MHTRKPQHTQISRQLPVHSGRRSSSKGIIQNPPRRAHVGIGIAISWIIVLIVAHVVNDNSQNMVTATLELRQRESIVVAFVCCDACPTAEVGFVKPGAHTESGAALSLQEDCAFDAGCGEVTSCEYVIVDPGTRFPRLVGFGFEIVALDELSPALALFSSAASVIQE